MIFKHIDCREGKKHEQTFEGFCGCSHANISKPPDGANYLAVTVFEDQLELWWLDGKDTSLAIDELRRYHRMTMGQELPIQVFKPCTPANPARPVEHRRGV